MGKKMRVDKLLSNVGVASRAELKKYCKQGLISVNGKVINNPGVQVDSESDDIRFNGEKIVYREFVYIMLNKPDGYISATFDKYDPIVLDLIDQSYLVFEPFPVGRLDKDTEGLLVLTNDGQLAHRVLSPKKHVPKTYYAKIQGKVTEEDILAFEKGVILDDGYETMPSQLKILKSDDMSEIELTIHEGKFHQVKRMFESVGKKVVYLKRLSMGKLKLDESLGLGEYRELTEEEVKLIEEISKVQENIVVVLCNGAPIEMIWIDKVKAVLEGYLGGQALGGAIADLLFGKVNPSGKLAETFPKKLSHNPSYLNFPGELDEVTYAEGNFVGYKYYDKKGIIPLFPFGYGLSYTTFEYSDIVFDKEEIEDKDTLKVSCKVRNSGNVKGKEVVQLYVRDKVSTVIRPDKELKDFTKVELNPGEEKELTFTLNKRSFAYYNLDINDYYVESGEFEILIGSSSQDIRLSKTVRVNSTTKIRRKFTMTSTVSDILNDEKASLELKKLIEKAAAKINLNIEILNKEENMFSGMLLRTVVDMAGFEDTEEVEKALDRINNN